MRISVAIQMDPPSRIDQAVDSSLELAREAIRRGGTVSWYEPRTLSLGEGALTAALHPMEFDAGGTWMNPAAPPVRGSLRDRDVVLIRQDPPFDMAYVTSTYLLEHLQPDVLVLNDPTGLRGAPEKLIPTYFPALTPPTLITSDIADIEAFREKHGALVLKPLYRTGGAGVLYVAEADPNLQAMIEVLCGDGLPIVAQSFIPEVAQGDKRIILIDGKAVGCLLRTPARGSVRANIHAGGMVSVVGLEPRDREICEAVGPILKETGLMLVGLDVIGPWMTEINVTSPGMLRVLKTMTGVDAAAIFWDAVAARLSA